ncbi:MAG: hypothetical protein H6817_11435 [Phycisphaerales bacterium]|nr:hypothetical protein [Phycisphaerales bacterium]
MIARFAGGVLGLFAFGVAATVGVIAGNPPMTVVSRALWALLIFCMIGLVIGQATQMVIDEYVTRQEEKLRSSSDDAGTEAEGAKHASAVATKATATE